MSDTKRIRIGLRAYTRLEHNAVITVPAEASREEITRLVRIYQESVDRSEFMVDPDYWDEEYPDWHEEERG